MYANGANMPPHNMSMPPPHHGGMPMAYYPSPQIAGPPPTMMAPPPSMMPQQHPPPTPTSHVGSHTNSKDPLCVKSRLFVGNLNTYRVTRDDVVKLFSACGNVLSVSVFKGYAFVQYATPIEAKLGVDTFNGYTWEGSELDVKLAFTGPYKTTKPKTNQDATPSIENSSVNAVESCAANKSYCKTFERREFEPHASEGKDDVLICGECQYRTNDLNDFAEHRSNDCDDDNEPPTEPTSIQCFTCDDTFATSWNLLQHLIDKHNLHLYRQDDKTEVQRRGPRTPSSLPPDEEVSNGHRGPRTPPLESDNENDALIKDALKARTPPLEEEDFDTDAPSPQPPSPALDDDDAV